MPRIRAESLAVAAAAFLVYGAGACPTFGAGSSPSWAAALAPVTGLWGANLLSSFFQAAALGLFHALLRRELSRGAALSAALALGCSKLFWYHGLIAGPWALVDFAAMAALTALWSRLPRHPAMLAALLFGLIALPELAGGQLLWAGVLFAAFGLRDRRARPWLLLFLPAILALKLAGSESDYHQALARQYYLLPLAAAAALAGYGLERLKAPWLGLLFAVPALVAPLSLRRHNAVAEYARQILLQTEDDAVIVAKSRELPGALRALGAGGRLVVPDPASVPPGRPVWFEAGWGRGRPVGVLYSETAKPDPAAASRLPALRAIRRWDRYHFTPEVFLTSTYRRLVEDHLAAAADDETRARLKQHLAEL